MVDPLAWAHPSVREWFVSRFGTPTEPQIAGWPPILARRNTLVSAPTGSGKTLAAFLACIDGLVRQALAGELRDRTQVLYISPLKALSNDIQKNLDQPLREIQQLAGAEGYLMPPIRTMVRTGDTSARERAAMLRKPPHILVTTPESLYILLTAARSREILRDVQTVIVDEIHALANNKRGAHLALSLERLDAIVQRPPVRIGLSATQRPLSLVGEFLCGQPVAASDEADCSRKLVTVEVPAARTLDLAIELPSTELGPIASNEMWGEIYERLEQLANQHRSTLVFVNTRRHVERISHRLAERMGEEAVAAHHGSLSRHLRLESERRLKQGECRILIATASLELGIDIGNVDLVCQIGSPRSLSTALQRVGRAGHWRGATPKGRFFPTTRDELVECAAVLRALKRGDLDQLTLPDAPLDILAQQIVAACATDEWDEDELFALVRRARNYRELPRDSYEKVLKMLSEGVSAKRGRYGAYLYRDQVNRRLRARRGARLAAITSGGAIPETALLNVVAMPNETLIGTLDEDFAVESHAGDIMLLGNTSWRIRRIEARTGRVLVEDAHGQPPTIPFWRGEAPGRSFELSAEVGEVRALSGQCDEELAAVIGPDARRQLFAYIGEGRSVLGAIPTQHMVIAERFFDEGGGMQLIIHAPFGARVNRAWGLALRKRFCRSFNFELQASATDDGISIALAEQHSFPLADVFNFLKPETVEDILQQAVLTGSPIFATRFRWDAQRSLALLRFRNGRKVPPYIQRIRADDLLAAVFPDVAACFENVEGDIAIPDHPLIEEVMKDVMHEAMDIDGLRQVLKGIVDGSIRTLAVDTPVPSQFAHEILNANPYAFLDDAPLEERRARAVQLRRTIPASVLEEAGKLDPAAIAQVLEESRPDIRDCDDLHDLLQTLILCPALHSLSELQPGHEHEAPRLLDTRSAFERTQLASWIGTLVETRRAVVAQVGEREFWVASENVNAFTSLHPASAFMPAPQGLFPAAVTAEASLDRSLLGWLQHSGPVTAAELSAMAGLETPKIDASFLRLEAAGGILRGHFRATSGTIEWCDRRLLSRIHHLTVASLRKQIEPATAAQYMRWLLRWQHVAPSARLAGEHGVWEAVRQLQGFEIPARAWERDILARRVTDYEGSTLDHLCLMGRVGWGRLSPHPATLDKAEPRARRIIPTSVAPITFFLREDCAWMELRRKEDVSGAVLSTHAQAVMDALRGRGASFLADLQRVTRLLRTEVENGLWELVTAGLVTADSFDNFRSLLSRARHSVSSHRAKRQQFTSGRWSLLRDADVSAEGSPHVLEHSPGTSNDGVESACWMLLRRYGVVFREVLARESNLPRWRELQWAFRSMENRGEVRGGRFVSGFVGEQFALPAAAESLRESRKVPASGELITVSAADPLNLVGIIVPGERVSPVGRHTVTFRDGAYVPEAEMPMQFVTPVVTAGGPVELQWDS